MKKTFAVYQRNACKSITDERGRAGSGENDLCQKKIKPFAEHDLRVTLECAGNNSVFGKTIENIRKRQNVHIIDNRKMADKLSSKPNFERLTISDENLVAVHKKTEVYFNKPIYVGQAILDL